MLYGLHTLGWSCVYVSTNLVIFNFRYYYCPKFFRFIKWVKIIIKSLFFLSVQKGRTAPYLDQRKLINILNPLATSQVHTFEQFYIILNFLFESSLQLSLAVLVCYKSHSSIYLWKITGVRVSEKPIGPVTQSLSGSYRPNLPTSIT